MKNVKIYLSGGMSGLSEAEQTQWRKKIQTVIKRGYYENKPIFFDPTERYSIFEKNYNSEKEIFEYDLYNVRNSDLVIVNFNDVKSIGTAMELMLAKELHIPVIGINSNGYAVGLNKDNNEIHPWFIECTARMCDTLEEAAEYVVNFFLN